MPYYIHSWVPIMVTGAFLNAVPFTCIARGCRKVAQLGIVQETFLRCLPYYLPPQAPRIHGTRPWRSTKLVSKHLFLAVSGKLVYVSSSRRLSRPRAVSHGCRRGPREHALRYASANWARLQLWDEVKGSTVGKVATYTQTFVTIVKTMLFQHELHVQQGGILVCT